MLGASVAATRSPACALRLAQHMFGTLLCPEKSTVSNLVCARGGQHGDWTADYRLYSRDGRVDESKLFGAVRRELLAHLPPDQALVVGLDDTIVRKSGRHIHGAGFKRDPLGPAFQTNLVMAQRYLQLSAAWPLPGGGARLVPLDFLHAPTPAKPPKKAAAEQQSAYREQLKQANLNRQALGRIRQLREDLPAARRLVLNGDGSYTNKTILRGLPEGCVYIGRTRKDCALHHPPAGPLAATGRRPVYGAPAPTPEELRSDDSVPWQTVRVFAAGKSHQVRLKTLGPVLWRKTGAAMPLRVVVIAPLAYRLRKGSKLLYRQPAYLLCTDPDLPLQQFVQWYFWRWGIEVNFREEKTLVGTGQAHVRTEPSNQHLPAVTVAAYAMLWAAALAAIADYGTLPCLRPPKWRQPPSGDHPLPSTGELLRLLRHEVWAGALHPDTFGHFVTHPPDDAKLEKLIPNLPASLFDAA